MTTEVEEHAQEAMDILVKIARDETNDPVLRAKAAAYILFGGGRSMLDILAAVDAAWGKSKDTDR